MRKPILEPYVDTLFGECESVDDFDSLEHIANALKELPKKKQKAIDAFIHVKKNGLSYSDAAEVLGVPQNTAKTFVKRTTDDIRNYFKRLGE